MHNKKRLDRTLRQDLLAVLVDDENIIRVFDKIVSLI